MSTTRAQWREFESKRLLVESRSDLLALTRTVHERCGDFAACRILGAKMYLVSHPDAIGTVLHADQAKYRLGEPDWSPFVRAAGRGLLYADGETHRRQRQLVQPFFQPKRVAVHARTVTESIQELQRQWDTQAGRVLDVHSEMLHLTLTAASRVLFTDALQAHVKRIGELSTAILLLSTDLYLRPEGRLAWLPTPRQSRFKRLIREYDSILFEAIRKRKAEGNTNNDLLSLVLQGSAEPGSPPNTEPLPDREVRDLAASVLSAAFETTATMLTWTWYLLAQNREAESNLHSELERVLAGRNATFVDLPRLPYTAQVLQETLRLFPPVWMIARRAIVDAEVQGYRVLAGARVLVSPYLVQRDPRWFPDPDNFAPSRFGVGNEAERPRFSYIPFGAGGRRCLGQPFAEMFGSLAIANLAQRFAPRLEPDRVIEPGPCFLRPRGGMNMRIVRR